MVQSAAHLPYCGAPPIPQAIWSRWNTDPVLLAALVLVAGAYVLLARRHALSPSRQTSFFVGWAITAVALASPLCALSVSLFSARIGQHMILLLLGAPLVAAGLPARAAGARAGAFALLRQSRLLASPLASAAAFAVLLWFWHAPAPYAATFASTAVYWAMHLSLYAAAVWLWHTFLDTTPSRTFVIIGAGVISSFQMGLLGALITFAPRAMYAPHALTTATWGLTPLSDQQLGGAIMWVPGCVVFLAIAMAMFWQAIAQSELSEHPELQAQRR